MKQFKLNIRRLLMRVIFLKQGKLLMLYRLRQKQQQTLACIQMFINRFDSNLV